MSDENEGIGSDALDDEIDNLVLEHGLRVGVGNQEGYVISLRLISAK